MWTRLLVDKFTESYDSIVSCCLEEEHYTQTSNKWLPHTCMCVYPENIFPKISQNNGLPIQVSDCLNQMTTFENMLKSISKNNLFLCFGKVLSHYHENLNHPLKQ